MHGNLKPKAKRHDRVRFAGSRARTYGCSRVQMCATSAWLRLHIARGLRTGLFALLAASAVFVMSACAYAPGSHTLAGRARGTAITFNLSQDPHNLNPILAQSDDERQIAHLMFDMLLDVDPKGRLVPALAVRVPTRANGDISPGGRVIIYHLRNDVRWQDGRSLTASDVIFTWRAITDRDNDVASTRGYDLVDLIVAPDPYTVVVRLRRSWAPAVATLFTYGDNPMPILPAHVFANNPDLMHSSFNDHPIGTGPYELVRWERGTRLIFRANKLYFRGPPKARTIVAAILPDTNTTMTMLQTGQLDWSLQSPAQRLALTRAPNLRFIYAPFAGFGGIAFDCRRPPFNDVRLRRAITMAIDRRRLSAAITGAQYPVTDSDLPRFSWAFDPNVRLPAFDPAAADRALDALGWRRGPDGWRARAGRRLALTFVTFPEGDTAVRTAEYVAEMLRARGIDVTIKKVTVAQFYLPASEGGLLLSGRYDMAYVVWRSGVDPDDSDLVTCRGAQNYAGYCNSQVDALESRALTAWDLTTRRLLYRRIQEILAHDVPYAYLYAPLYSFAVQRGLRGFDPTPFSPTWNAYTWHKGS